MSAKYFWGSEADFRGVVAVRTFFFVFGIILKRKSPRTQYPTRAASLDCFSQNSMTIPTLVNYLKTVLLCKS